MLDLIVRSKNILCTPLFSCHSQIHKLGLGFLVNCKSVHWSTIFLTWKYKKSFTTAFSGSNPLVDGPDFTFLDGRPPPLRVGQRRRALEQKEAILRAFTLKKEIDFAKEHFSKMIADEKAERQRIMNSKLKEKGDMFQQFKR